MERLGKFNTKEYNKKSKDNQDQKYPLYQIWSSMKNRCYNKSNNRYYRYGARGVRVCDEWLNNYKQFELDMGVRPKGFTLDRIDSNGNYEKNNCRWSSTRTQNLNKDYVINAKGYHKTLRGTFIAIVTHNYKNTSKTFKKEEDARAWYEANRPRIEV